MVSFKANFMEDTAQRWRLTPHSSTPDNGCRTEAVEMESNLDYSEWNMKNQINVI